MKFSQIWIFLAKNFAWIYFRRKNFEKINGDKFSWITKNSAKSAKMNPCKKTLVKVHFPIQFHSHFFHKNICQLDINICNRVFFFFYWSVLLWTGPLNRQWERDKITRMDNKVFLNFEINFWWKYNKMKESLIKWKKIKETVICNDQIVLMECSTIYINA